MQLFKSQLEAIIDEHLETQAKQLGFEVHKLTPLEAIGSGTMAEVYSLSVSVMPKKSVGMSGMKPSQWTFVLKVNHSPRMEETIGDGVMSVLKNEGAGLYVFNGGNFLRLPTPQLGAAATCELHLMKHIKRNMGDILKDPTMPLEYQRRVVRNTFACLAEIHRRYLRLNTSEKTGRPTSDADLRSEYSHFVQRAFGRAFKHFPVYRRKYLTSVEANRMLGQALNLIKSARKDFREISEVHGDFWWHNVGLDDDDEVVLLDSSRLRFGMGFYDVAWWSTELVWLYHETGEARFRDLCDYSHECYLEHFPHSRILERIVPIIALKTWIKLDPHMCTATDSVARKFTAHVKLMLRRKIFCWK